MPILRCILVVLSVVLILACPSYGEDWPNWRGPTYNGHSSEKGFKTNWDGDLETVWEHPIGAGYSGIVIAKGRAYTCGQPGKKQVLYCFDADSGKVIWEKAFEPRYRNHVWNGPRTTPTVHKGRVYILGAKGKLACFDATDGEEKWSRNFDHVPQWGYSGSVLIQGKLALVTAGGQYGGLRALNRKTGKELWKCGTDGDSGYSTPYPFEFEGTKYVCGFLGKSVSIADLKTGKEVLSMPWETEWKVNAATPIYHDGYLFLSSGYQTGCAVYKLSKSGKALKATQVWRSKKMRNKFQTPVLHDGYLYSFDQKGFKCLDFMTGDVRWSHRGGEHAHGSVILANDHLVALTQDGLLRIGKASPESFHAVGEAQILTGQCWTVPTLSDGRIYARNHKKIVCIDLRS
ncbi:MAG: PQQ-like beta-propeller repeat protein [Phycisphaerales bacterium]|nr:PQQ-like beta-propeller repeat protein [Phycisphaerales bacterium]